MSTQTHMTKLQKNFTWQNTLMFAGKQLLEQRYEEIKDAIASGIVDETKPVGKNMLIFVTIMSHFSLS